MASPVRKIVTNLAEDVTHNVLVIVCSDNTLKHIFWTGNLKINVHNEKKRRENSEPNKNGGETAANNIRGVT